MATDPNQPQSGEAERRKQAVARLISALVAKVGPDGKFNEKAIIAKYPQLMPELQIALKKLSTMRAGRTASVVGVTAIPPAGGVFPSAPVITIPGYSIERELGTGGQAIVYLAIQQNTGRKVAVKVMHPEALADERALARFKREVRVLAALDHPNIVGILDAGVTSTGSQFIAMNYVAGTTLDEYMKSHQRADSPDPASLLRLFLRICEAVNVAHVQGIVHRDLKPGNIRIDERGEPHILDFGLAHTPLDRLAGGDHPIAVTGEFLGSLPWCSPEQAQGDPDRIDMRTDVYSLGVILYQILTGGKFPYEVVGNIRDVLNNILNAEPMPPSKVAGAATAPQVIEDRPPGKLGPPPVNETVERIVLKALAKNRELRYQSAGELGRDVENYLAGRQTSVGHPAPPESASRIVAPSKWLGRVSLAAIILFAVCVGIWIERRRTKPPLGIAVASAAPLQLPTVSPTSQPKVEITSPEPVSTMTTKQRDRAFTIVGGTCHLEGDELVLTPGPIQCVMFLGFINWSTYDLSFQFMMNGPSDGKGIRVFLHSALRNNCQFTIGRDDNSLLEFASRYEGVMQRIASRLARVEPDRWYQVRVEVRGEDIRCFLDGQECFHGKDPRFTHGRVGLAVFDPGVRFRDIKVTATDGAVMWQGPPDMSRVPTSEIDPPMVRPKPDARKTDLLKEFDPASNALAGNWSTSAEGITAEGPAAQIQFQSPLPPEYDYRVTFIRQKGDAPIALIASQHGRSFAWVVGGDHGTVMGLGQLNGFDYDDDRNVTKRRAAEWIDNGHIHTLVLRVRKDLVLAYIDGQQKDAVPGDADNLALPASMRQAAPSHLGVWLGGDDVTIKSADMFELTSKPSAAAAPDK